MPTYELELKIMEFEGLVHHENMTITEYEIKSLELKSYTNEIVESEEHKIGKFMRGLNLLYLKQAVNFASLNIKSCRLCFRRRSKRDVKQ